MEEKKTNIRSFLNKILSLSNDELDLIDTSYIEKFVPVIGKIHVQGGHCETDEYFHRNSGSEHYRLLTCLSSLVHNSIIFDIGTNYCLSALALSNNKSNIVLSYDIIDKIDSNYKNKNLENLNIEFIIGDSTNDSRISESNLIFFDAEHDGIFENIFYQYLKEINWKGLLILDDIHLNDPMRKFWNIISEEKHDITRIGHWSGTGLVIFE